jgi:hypothetical protein
LFIHVVYRNKIIDISIIFIPIFIYTAFYFSILFVFLC